MIGFHKHHETFVKQFCFENGLEYKQEATTSITNHHQNITAVKNDTRNMLEIDIALEESENRDLEKKLKGLEEKNKQLRAAKQKLEQQMVEETEEIKETIEKANSVLEEIENNQGSISNT